ncbi:site-specific integrase, partial [Patescibacteria group bacterium]|nr:site-specific integrase [Patescibacteria group bacterium]
MTLLEKFKYYLNTDRNKPSEVTIKNYLSDVRKFITWFENQSHANFHPTKITSETINVYKAYLIKNEAPANSIERYLSSLRKFFNYLKQENLINNIPFNREINIKYLSKDPLMLDQFKIYLLSNNISKTTIKNYLMDIRHFLSWLDKVLCPIQNQNILNGINISLIDEYKYRLLKETHLSPVSLNRKLSSLRKYLNWIGKKDIDINNISLTNNTGRDIKKTINIFKEIRSKNNEKLHENSNKTITPSPFKLIDIIIAIPLVKTLEAVTHHLWKIKGANVFTPAPQEYQKSPAKLAKLLTIFSISKNIKNHHIHNTPKSIYAPLEISTRSLPKHKRIYFHLLHTRPKWYNIYHSYPIVHYFHTAILLILTTIIGSTLFNNFYESSKQNTVFANPPWIQPKILTFQGKLKDSYNNPIITDTPLRFAIYNNLSASGAALLWQEVQTINPDTNGSFKTQIGQKNPISSSIFFDNPALYLGITVKNDNELQPRQEITTVSYSNNSQQLQGLIPITKNNAGTKNVILALDSAGNLTIGEKAAPTFEASDGQFTISGKTLLLTSVIGSDSNVIIAPDGNGIIDLQKPLQNTTNNNNIESAQGAVEIDDLLAILATSSGQSALTINQNSTGPLISASTSGIAMFTLENNGTGIFTGNLFINGNSLTSANTSFNLLNTDTINLNIGNTATAISLGAGVGNTTINNTLITSSAYIDNLYT